MKSAIILCSGGIDSVTTAYYVKNKLNYNNLEILFFNYGQRAIKAERKASKFCAREIRAKFLEVDLKWLKNFSSNLTNNQKSYNKLTKKDLKDTKNESLRWYVPLRNTIFLNYATTLAESEFLKVRDLFGVLDVQDDLKSSWHKKNKTKCDIFVGFKNEGKEFYPDTTKEYVNQMNKLNSISTISKPKILTPLIKKDKEDIINLALKLKVPLKKTFSCYTSNSIHCGTCLSCRLRQEGFYWTNQKDETKYLEK